MAVIDERYKSAIDTGAPFAGGYLAGFVRERMRMAEAAVPGDDSAELARAEADARDRIARLRQKQGELRASSQKVAGGLEAEKIKAKAKIIAANIKAGSDKYRTDRQFRADMMKLFDDRAAKIATDMEIGGTTRDLLRALDSDESAPETVIREALASAGDPAAGTPAHDAIAFEAYQKVKAREARQGLDSSRSQQVIDKFFDGADPGVVMVLHQAKTPEDVKDMIDDELKKGGGGGYDAEKVDKWFADVVNPAMEVATETETDTTTAGTPGDADALQTAIDDLEDYADQLAADRKAARAGRYPVGHTFLDSPNSYVRGSTSALSRYGILPERYTGEVVAELQRAGGRPGVAARAIGERGGLESERRRDYAPEIVGGTMGDLGGWVADRLALAGGFDVQGEEGWGYRFDPATGDVSITAAPPGHEKAVGKSYKATGKGSAGDIYKAIIEKEVKRSPAWAQMEELQAVVSKQPEAVRAFLAPAIALAAKGDVDGAARLAREVSPVDVETAYAEALASGKDQQAVLDGLASLGEMGGELGRAALDRVAGLTEKSSRYDLDAARGHLEDIGRASLAGLADKPRERALEKAAAREDKAFVGEPEDARVDRDADAYAAGRRAGEAAVKGLDMSNLDVATGIMGKAATLRQKGTLTDLERGMVEAMEEAASVAATPSPSAAARRRAEERKAEASKKPAPSPTASAGQQEIEIEYDVDVDDLLAYAAADEERSRAAGVARDYYSPTATAARSLAPSPAEAEKTRRALEGLK